MTETLSEASVCPALCRGSHGIGVPSVMQSYGIRMPSAVQRHGISVPSPVQNHGIHVAHLEAAIMRTFILKKGRGVLDPKEGPELLGGISVIPTQVMQ